MARIIAALYIRVKGKSTSVWTWSSAYETKGTKSQLLAGELTVSVLRPDGDILQ